MTNWPSRPSPIIRAAASGFLALIAAWIAYAMLGAPQLYSWAGATGLFALMFPLFLVIPAVAAACVAVFAAIRRERVNALLAGCAATSLAALALWPPMAQWRIARAAGVELSPSRYLSEAFAALHRTAPPHTFRYATITDGAGLELDWWPAESAVRKPRPALVMIHGGGWVEGGRSDMQAWDRWGQGLGYDVFDVSYRLPPPARWREEVGDVKCALGWIEAHAPSLGIDPSRISLIGYSAGGNLALLAAYSMRDGTLPPTCPAPPAPIRTVINLYGPSDLVQLRRNSATPAYVAKVTDAYVGGPPQLFRDRYRLLSPLAHVTPAAPPTISFLGENDRLVSREQLTNLDAALTRAAAPHESWLVPGADHVFDGDWGSFATQFARAKAQAFLQRFDPAPSPRASPQPGGDAATPQAARRARVDRADTSGSRPPPQT